MKTFIVVLVVLALAGIAGGQYFGERLFCPECQRQGLKSTVSVLGSSRTLAYAAPYYNEDGNYVQPPDPNTTTTEYECSRGHRFCTKNGRIITPESQAQDSLKIFGGKNEIKADTTGNLLLGH